MEESVLILDVLFISSYLSLMPVIVHALSTLFQLKNCFFNSACLLLLLLSHFSHVLLCVTP